MAFNYWQQMEETGIYHMFNRSISRERLFKNKNDYRYFLMRIKKYLLPYVDVWAYCLIPNHFHFLIEIKEFDEITQTQLKKEKTKASHNFLSGAISTNRFIEDQFRRLFSSYALHFNARYQRHGALFQKRAKRVSIDKGNKLITAICYIHHNPIHHGLSHDYQDWQFSSYKSYLSEKPAWICRGKSLKWLGSGDLNSGKNLFIEFHKEYRQPLIEDWTME